MTTEQNAESKGPLNPEGNEKSGNPHHRAVLSSEDPAEFVQLLNELRAVYLPLNGVAASIVGDIAVARWQILRFDGLITSQWNLPSDGEPP